MPDSLPPNWRPLPSKPSSKPVNPHTADLRVWLHDFVAREGRASIAQCHLAVNDQ